MFHLVAVVVFLVSEPLIKKFLSGSCWRKKTIPLVSQNRSRDQEIRSNQQLSASCGFIKSGKIALIVAHRVKLSHQNVFWGNYLKHSPCRLVEPDVCCVARASLQKGKTPFAPGLFVRVSDNKAALHLITLLVLMRLQGLRCGRVITPHLPQRGTRW